MADLQWPTLSLHAQAEVHGLMDSHYPAGEICILFGLESRESVEDAVLCFLCSYEWKLIAGPLGCNPLAVALPLRENQI